jgi:hypothetical protein
VGLWDVRGERELHTGFGRETLKVRNHLANLTVDRIRLKWIRKLSLGMTWIGLISLMTVTRGGLL